MFHSIAFHLANNIITHCHISPGEKETYIYGSELFLSTCFGALSIVVISGLSHHLMDGLIFLLIFIGIRLFSGGFHASTYFRCFILSNFTYLAAFFLSCLLIKAHPAYGFLMIALSDLTILAYSPIRNENHPLSDRTYKKNKTIARALTLFDSGAIILCYAFTQNHTFLSISSASLFAVASLILFAKIKKRSDIYEKLLGHHGLFD